MSWGARLYIGATGVLFLLMMFVGLSKSDPDHRGYTAFRCAVACWALGLLVGCGGGDVDEPVDQPTPHVQCQQHPEVCQ